MQPDGVNLRYFNPRIMFETGLRHWDGQLDRDKKIRVCSKDSISLEFYSLIFFR